MSSQKVIAAFDGLSLKENPPALRAISSGAWAGVILYDSNIASPKQVRCLCQELKEAGGSKFQIMIDQEGGAVARLANKKGFFQGRSAAALANCTQKEVREEARKQADQLRELGIDINLAPCVDLAVGEYIVSKGRAYHGDPERVIEWARCVIEAHKEYGVGCCLKHFPGHGSSDADTHLGWSDISRCWDELELLPYKVLIAEGLVDMVMVGHVYHRSFDSVYPASLSRAVVQELLRDALKFRGTVVSDDLSMQAVAGKFSQREAVKRATKAGVDLVLLKENCPVSRRFFS